MNRGQLNEQMFSKRFGIALNSFPTERFYEGSDTINGISLKSNRFSIPSRLEYYDRNLTSVSELIDNHVKHSTSRCYCITIRNLYYFMSKRLFAETMKQFGYLTVESGSHKVKVKCDATLKMAKWLESKGIKGVE